MKIKIMLKLCFCVTLISGSVGSLSAQKDSGKIYYQEQFPNEQKIVNENGVSFMITKNGARVVSDDPKSPFHETTGVCQAWSVPVGDGNAFSTGFCMLADKDGDTYMAFMTIPPDDSKEFELIVRGGTGKFKNINGKGKTSEMMAAKTKKEGECCMQKWTLKY